MSLDLGRRIKLRVLLAACRLFGNGAIHLVLEAIEVHGVRKYLDVWSRYRDGPLAEALREILVDEFKHEDLVVTARPARTSVPRRAYREPVDEHPEGRGREHQRR